MAYRALIIGIQNYSEVSDGSLADELPGTIDAAVAFRDWLAKKWKDEGVAESQTQMIVCSEPLLDGGRPATVRAVLAALNEIKDRGQGATDEFYVFFSGHGFSFEEGGIGADFLIASDFESLALSGNCCFNLNKTIYWLRQHLGPGRHHYFVDACRNLLDERQIVPTGPSLPRDPQVTSEASSFVLQSIDAGGVAPADRSFPDALIAGLRGAGEAKTWDEGFADALVVRFDTLWRYLEDVLRPRQVHGASTGTQRPEKAVYAVLRPVPSFDCIVEIAADLPSRATIECVGLDSGSTVKVEVAGRLTTVTLPADRYRFNAYDDTTGRILAGPVVRKIYDAASILVVSEIVGAPAARTAPAGPLSDVGMPTDASVELRSEEGVSFEFQKPTRTRIPRGRYDAVLRDGGSRVVKRFELDIARSGKKIGRLSDWASTVAHVSIAAHFEKDGGGINFSESFERPVDDPDLDLWLAIIGAGRILGSATVFDYSKIGLLPLKDFGGQAADVASVYVLGGFDDAEARLDVGVGQGRTGATWKTAWQPGSMNGISECFREVDSGSVLVSLRLNGGPVSTVASFASPNWSTLITVTLDVGNGFRISQYILPVGAVAERLGSPIDHQSRNRLADVRKIAVAQRAFRKRQELPAFLDETDLADLRQGRWPDPIAIALAAYEDLRRGRPTSALDIVEAASTIALPDFDAIRTLARGGDPVPSGATPIFLDGLRACDTDVLPLPAAFLDYGSAWTFWRSAVKR